jgi:hypothetical protein
LINTTTLFNGEKMTTVAPDRRARLRPKPKGEDYVYGNSDSLSNNMVGDPDALTGSSVDRQPDDITNFTARGLLQILRQTNGMVWPYTPTINIQNTIDYTSYDPVHSNQEQLTFSRTKAPQITCSGIFTAQTSEEAHYLLACMHFLRSVTKMDFGVNSTRAGTPPPILLFSAYGNLMMNDLPVVITNFAFDLPPDKDYVKVPLDVDNKRLRDIDVAQEGYKDSNGISFISDSQNWVPSEMSIAVSMTVQNSPNRQTNTFNLKAFKNGTLLSSSDTKGWI